jgi:hypothetical protein
MSRHATPVVANHLLQQTAHAICGLQEFNLKPA